MAQGQGTKRLILHVGHGKTGSSALQSSFALSVERLAAHGIAYPVFAGTDDASAGLISSGNVDADSVTRIAREALAGPAETVLLSNETLFVELMRMPDLLPGLLALGVRIEVILFIRNPLAHAISTYGQAVKRKGLTRMPGPHLRRYDVPEQVARFIDLMRAQDVALHILNYSNHARDLRSPVAQILSIPADVLTPPARRRVNRSLTRAELHLQRAFNAHWGRESAEAVSDALCNALPEIEAEPPFLERSGYGRFVRLQSPVIERVNALLPEGERYAMERYEDVFGDGTAPDGRHAFTDEQLDVLARSITDRVRRPELTEELGDMVLGLETGRALSPGELDRLLTVAIRLHGAAGGDVVLLRRRRRALRDGIEAPGHGGGWGLKRVAATVTRALRRGRQPPVVERDETGGRD